MYGTPVCRGSCSGPLHGDTIASKSSPRRPVFVFPLSSPPSVQSSCSLPHPLVPPSVQPSSPPFYSSSIQPFLYPCSSSCSYCRRPARLPTLVTALRSVFLLLTTFSCSVATLTAPVRLAALAAALPSVFCSTVLARPCSPSCSYCYRPARLLYDSLMPSSGTSASIPKLQRLFRYVSQPKKAVISLETIYLCLLTNIYNNRPGIDIARTLLSAKDPLPTSYRCRSVSLRYDGHDLPAASVL